MLISLHIQTGQVDLTLAQFEQMNARDIVSWNTMITGYNKHVFDILALNMFSKMLEESSLEPDRYTLASGLSACANLGELNVGKQIHARLIITEFDMSGSVGNSLICMYSQCAELNLTFTELPETPNGTPRSAPGGVDIVRKILEDNRKSSVNVIAFTALLDGYIKLGDISAARKIFDSLKDRDVVLWTTMIVGYVQNGLNDDAMELFRLMVKEGPDGIIIL
ncbi:Pentatricopeptide repeat-containing protein [Capsicum chinense]|nr:Pentatricopeptide repeat-containing protein [Capsicum chinense]